VTIAYFPSAARDCPSAGAGRLSVSSATRGRGASRQTSVVVRGEVDAANAKEFAVAVRDRLPSIGTVILDLTGLEFIAVDGIAALHAVNAYLARAGATWHTVPSRAVQRVLDLCDPEGLIPRVAPVETQHAIA
jgi:anti-anti-sigma factor